MASQESYTSTAAIGDPELARRKKAPTEDSNVKDATDADLAEKEKIDHIINARKRYSEDRKGKEREWVESFKMYMSWVDKALNPFLSNLFIPKTHEAVELLAAFLIGSNQTISATPENGSSDTMKAKVASKWLDWLWRKPLKARLKILVWIKQALIFGNGIMKFGWDANTKLPWMQVCAIEDVYFDYFEAIMQDSEYIIHEIRRNKDDVMDDDKYDAVDKDGKTIRSQVIVGGDQFGNGNTATQLFNTFDGSFSRSENRGKVLLMEVWCKEGVGAPQKLITLLPTSLGWRIGRNADNPNRWRNKNGEEGPQFRPFAKLRFKTSALPNRAYDTGAVWPSVHIQKAFNDLFRQYFDSVVMINNPMWKKRRGARINPAELVRKPGGIITMGDVTKDLVTDVVGDVKQSIIEMLNRLDSEFQQASMVVNLLKGIQGQTTATEVSLGQQNVQTLLDMVNENVIDALSEAGQMVLAISLANAEGVQSLVMYEDDKEMATLDFEPKNIDGQHDVRIVPDQTDNTTKAAQNKALTQFIALVRGDANTLAKYPSLVEKLYKRFLTNDGVGDPDYFFQEDAPTQAPPADGSGGDGKGGAKESLSINYKDAPPDIQRQMEAAAGFTPSKMPVQAQVKPEPVKSPVSVPTPTPAVVA